jgi:hypothetical protein
MSRYLLQIGLVGGGIAAFAAYDAADKSMNYVHVDATISGIEQTCFLEKKESDKRTFSDPMPCSKAKWLVENHPAYQGFHNVRDVELTLSYPDPTTKESTEASLKLSRYKDYPDLRRGDSFAVLVHKSKPGKVRAP